MPPIYLLTGIQAAGKSSVAEALAARVAGPSVHVHGDQFRRWIVNGRVEMTPNPTPAALDQLQLRHRLTVAACAEYTSAGFTVIAQDVILGPQLRYMVDRLAGGPLHVIVLVPRPDVIAAREAGRAKQSYGRWTIEVLDRGLREETPRLGLWLDTSELTIEQTVEEIVRRPHESVITGTSELSGGPPAP